MVLQIIQPCHLNNREITRAKADFFPNNRPAVAAEVERPQVDAVVDDGNSVRRNSLVGDKRLPHSFAYTKHTVAAFQQQSIGHYPFAAWVIWEVPTMLGEQ